MVFSSATTSAQSANTGPGTSIQQKPLDGVFIPIKGGHHGYDPNNPQMYIGFIAYGKDIRKRNIIDQLTAEHIVPISRRKTRPRHSSVM